MNYDSLKKVIDETARECGISEYEIYYMSAFDASVSALKKEINASSVGESGGLSLRVLKDGKMGYAATELLTEDEMKRLVFKAKENAENTEKPDTVGIFKGSSEYPRHDFKEKELLSNEKMAEVALELQNAAYAADSRVTDGTQSSVSSFGFEVRLSNSWGLDLKNSAKASVIVTEVAVSDGNESNSAYSVEEYDSGMDIKKIAADTAKKATDNFGAGYVESGKYNVVISGKEMKSILAVFSPVFNAKYALMGMSLLKGKEGEMIASPVVTVSDTPAREEVCVKSYFDAEGVSARAKNVIKNGKLITLLHNRETAKAYNTETTGNASKSSYSSPVSISPYAFCIEGGENTLEDLYKMAGSGIYVTSVRGLHAGANPMTGDFSIESGGFMIENGVLGKPVKSFTIAGNFYDLLKSVKAVSDKVTFGVSGGVSCFGSADVLCEGVSVGGK